MEKKEVEEIFNRAMKCVRDAEERIRMLELKSDNFRRRIEELENVKK